MTYLISQCADIILADPKSDVAAKAYASAITANRLLAEPPNLDGVAERDVVALIDTALRKADGIQALYILNNLSHWRHAEAKRVRASLKLIAGLKLNKKEREAVR